MQWTRKLAADFGVIRHKMDVTLILLILINFASSGMKMGRHMTLLFQELKEKDRELWKDLAQLNTSNMFDVPGYMRGNIILFKGSKQLEVHPILSQRYRLARKWFLWFQISNIVLFVILFVILFVLVFSKNVL
ncbi:hypothetical protein ACLKMH_12095 [Psychromonas sp. KJ10-10]|uniref:hypothetical protein n=1 Tax=Psychromonas sp. KJ10-10 TaxID=3391823 RepID=UPI0039B3B325